MKHRLHKTAAFAVILVGAVQEGYAQRPHPDPLPVTVVDMTLFPRHTADRYLTAGPTVYVAASGQDAGDGSAAEPVATIGRALERLAETNGSRIVIAGGTYAEGAPDEFRALVIDRDGTVLQAAPGQQVVIRPSAAHINYGLDILASGVTVQGISFEGFREAAVTIGVQGRTLRDIVLADCRIEMLRGGDGIGIYPDHRGSGQPVVDGVLFENVSVVDALNAITVGSGPARNLAFRGIGIRNFATASGNSGADAIAIENGDNVLINGAEISGAEADGIDLKVSRASVINAHVHHVQRNGIKLWAGGEIINSLVHDTGADAAIVLEGNPDAAVRYRIVNTVVAFHNRNGGESYALTCGYDTPVARVALEIVNSVFYRNTGGLALSAGTEAVIANSLFAGTRNHVVLEYGIGGREGQILGADGVSALSRAGLASANLPFDTDPRFAQPATNTLEGFALTASSPLVDAGLDGPAGLLVDLAGRARPVRTIDIGSQERP